MKDKFIKVLMILFLGSFALNLSLVSVNLRDNTPKPRREWVGRPAYSESLISLTENDTNQSSSNLLGYLFQIMFILFFISPPIIAFMLFLIWKELKEGNKMK